jgi:hypothetical protein
MKWASGGGIAVLMILLSAPLIHGQDLSKYRSFSFGMSVSDIAKQIAKTPADATVVHQRPVPIQQLTWWPPASLLANPLQSEAVQQIRFIFYDGKLFRMGTTYDSTAIRGLTAEDMIRAMSGKYGPATSPGDEVTESYGGTTEKVLARWEDPQYSFNLIQSSLSNTFELVMFVKVVDAQAAQVNTDGLKLESQQASLMELARAKRDADDMETARQKNLKVFLP